jgi:signal peptidase I
MLRILKVTGDSMSPDFEEGDFVVITTVPFFLNRLHVGDVIIFDHKLYGTLIKRIASFDPETAEVYVEGAHPDSLDSRRLGTISPGHIRGKVIAHFPKNNQIKIVQ